jgi:hypothetical protein
MGIFPKLLKFTIELMFTKSKTNKKSYKFSKMRKKCLNNKNILKMQVCNWNIKTFMFLSIFKSIDCIENKFKYFYENLYVNNKRKLSNIVKMKNSHQLKKSSL